MFLRRAVGRALRRLGARRVRLGGGGTGTGAERALSARRSSRYQRNALTGEPDSEPQLEAWAGRPIGVRVAAGFEVDLVNRNRPLRDKCLPSAASPRSSPPMWPVTRV
jgi:hypothetical protein